MPERLARYRPSDMFGTVTIPLGAYQAPRGGTAVHGCILVLPAPPADAGPFRAFALLPDMPVFQAPEAALDLGITPDVAAHSADLNAISRNQPERHCLH